MKFEHERRGIGTGAVVAAVIVVILIVGAAYFIFYPGSSSSTTSTSTTVSTTTTSTTSTTTTTSSTSTSSGSGQTAQIIIPAGIGSNLSANFEPSSLTVTSGTTIVFVNKDTGSIHNIDFFSTPSGVSIQKSPNTNQWTNNEYNVTLTTAGTYDYKCDYHAWMNASITVTGGSGTTTTTSTNASSSSTTTTTSSSSSTATSTSTSTSTSSGSSTSAAGATITIPQGAGTGKNFSPNTLTVTAGTTITFVDDDSLATHNVYFTSMPSGATISPNPSPDLIKGDSFTVTLTVPGTYNFVCQYHSSWMTGTITVTS